MLTAVTNRRKSGTKPLNQDGEQLRPSLMSFINHRERRPIVRRPPGFICKSFVDALPAANKQRSGRWSTLPPPPSNAIYLHGHPAPRSPPWMEVAVVEGGAVLAFAPAWHADANGLAQESRLDWLFQS